VDRKELFGFLVITIREFIWFNLYTWRGTISAFALSMRSRCASTDRLTFARKFENASAKQRALPLVDLARR